MGHRNERNDRLIEFSQNRDANKKHYFLHKYIEIVFRLEKYYKKYNTLHTR